MDEDAMMITDITLDHLPDISDASLSFQIPATCADAADLLLADHTEFDLLCDASVDDDGDDLTAVHARGRPPLAPAEMATMPSDRQTPPPTPGSSAVTAPPLCLGHHSSPSPSRHIARRPLESPLVSEERWDYLRNQVATLGQPVDDAPAHVHAHVILPVQEGDAIGPTESRVPALDGPPEETVSDGADPTKDAACADATNTTRAAPRAELSRHPRTTNTPAVPTAAIPCRPVFPTTHVSHKKPKKNPSRVKEANSALPSAPSQPVLPQSISYELVPPASLGGDTDINSENAQIAHHGTQVADRLVSHSQEIISSIGLYDATSERCCRSPESASDADRAVDARVRSRTPATPSPPSSPVPPPHIAPRHAGGVEPLRLSEISPPKPPANAPQSNFPVRTGLLQPQQGWDAVPPTRPPKKRLSMDADLAPENHRRKKGKMMMMSHANTDSERRSSDEAGGQDRDRDSMALFHEARRAQPETQDPGTTRPAPLPAPTESILPSARRKYRPRFNFASERKGPTLDAFPYVSASRQARETSARKGKRDHQGQSLLSRSLERRNVRARHGNAVASCRERQGSGPSGPTSTGDLPSIEKTRTTATLSVPGLTRPVGFTFRVDARMEARKREERLAASEPGKTSTVPEYKTLRGSHPVAFVFHKEDVPSVPVVPFFFCTEQRAKEREKFDAMMKRKEEEVERLKEEQRRRDAEEEERAIRQLRRKAIPKANEIPEWYAEMPKRKGAAV